MLRYFLEIGSLKFASYGLMLVISFWVGGFIAVRRARTVGMSSDWMIFVAVGMMLTGLLGSRLLYLLSETPRAFFANPLIYFQFSSGGLSFAGGFVLAIAFGFWQCKKRGHSFLTLMDLVMISVCLGQAITKIGCFLAGCCYGKTCELPWAVTYTEAHTLAPKFVSLHPAQLYESLMAFVVYSVLLKIWDRRRFEGQVFLSFLILFGLGRVVLEFFRSSETVHRFGLSTPQVILGMLAVLALASWPRLSRNRLLKGHAK